jgi:hypothetical protein
MGKKVRERERELDDSNAKSQSKKRILEVILRRLCRHSTCSIASCEVIKGRESVRYQCKGPSFTRDARVDLINMAGL